MDGHVCRGKLIKKYPSSVCSFCNGKVKDVKMEETEIDDYNRKTLNKFVWKDVIDDN